MATNNAGNIATGSSGTVLTGNGVGAAPTFQAAPSNAGASSFLAYASAAQTFTNLDTTPVQVVFDTETYDIANNYNAGTYTYTVPTTGKIYLFTASLSFTMPALASSGDDWQLSIYLNGAPVASSNQIGETTAPGDSSILVNWQGQLTATDTVTVFFSKSSGGALTTVSSGGVSPIVSWFMATQVS